MSIFFGGWYTHPGFGPRETWQEKFLHCLQAPSDHNPPPLIVMDPIVARLFVDLGFDTKEKLIEWLRRERASFRRANTGTTSGCRR